MEIDNYDELKMYFGEPYKINDKLIIYQPTIGQIVEFGEREYYTMVHMLTCIPSDMKSQLEDMKINYMDISDFELFIMLTRGLKKEQTQLLLGDIDLASFETGINKENNELILFSEQQDIIIDRLIYEKMVRYMRKMHGIVPKIEKAANETTRQILIQLDREKNKKAKEENKSQLKELISAMMRYPAFKYKKNELKECGLYEFMDTVQGAQIYISSTALIQGMYSGMIDTSKINQKEFNWLRSPNEK